VPAERRGEAEHETDDDSRYGQHDEHLALQWQHTEHECPEGEGDAEDQPAEEAEYRAAVDFLHPGFASS
jgi:hypothetical protein